MAPIIEGPPEAGEPKRPLAKRLGWFALIWFASLLAVAAVAYALRALIV
jgi:Protein of unknown function (DUF2474)